jgi:hypothetical protein
MRYRRAVEKLRTLASACDAERAWPGDDPILLEAYAFGEVLDGPDELDRVEVVLVLNLPAEEVVWESTPRQAVWLEDSLRLNKGGYSYRWRSSRDSVSNHRIRRPVRFWSREGGPDEGVLQALSERRFGDLPRLETPPEDQREQVAGELAVAFGRLRAVRDSYWDQQWRREHRGFGRYPENELWDAIDGYLDLYDASQADPGEVSGEG